MLESFVKDYSVIPWVVLFILLLYAVLMLNFCLYMCVCEQDDIPAMLSYAFKVCMSLIQHRQFRNTILNVLTNLYMGLQVPDYINVCQVLYAVCGCM